MTSRDLRTEVQTKKRWTIGEVERYVFRFMLYYVVLAGLLRLPRTSNGTDLSREALALTVCVVVAIAGLAITAKVPK